MRAEGGALILYATDLSNFLNCRHRTALELGEARGKRPRPVWADPLLEALFSRGLEHERHYLSRLDAPGKRITNLSEIRAREDALAATLEASRPRGVGKGAGKKRANVSLEAILLDV